MEIVKRILKEHGLGPIQTEQGANTALSAYKLQHLADMVVAEGYRTKGGYTFDREDMQGILQFLETIDFEDARSGSQWLSNALLDWTMLVLFGADRFPNVRIVPSQTYELVVSLLRRAIAEGRKVVAPTAHTIATRSAELKESADDDLNRQLSGAAELTRTLVRRSAAVCMRAVGARPGRPLINFEDGVYAAVVLILRNRHFTFLVLDAETAEGVSSPPTAAYFDGLGGDADLSEDLRAVSFANIAPLQATPTVERGPADQDDEWSCGYRSIYRARDVVRWLAGRREYLPHLNALRNEEPLLDSDGVFMRSISTSDCKQLHRQMQLHTALAYAYWSWAQQNA